MCGAQTPGRVYHRGSKTVVHSQPNPVKQLLFKWCPPVCRNCNEPCQAITPALVATVGVTLAPGVVDQFNFTWEGAFLLVEYGSGDPDLQTVELDLMNGVSFPLIGGGGKYVNFYIVYPTLPPSALEVVPFAPDIEVSISVGVHGYGGTGPRSARRTVFVGDLAALAVSAVFPVPRYAVGAAFATTDTLAALSFQQLASPLAGGTLLAQDTLSKLEYESVPVVHGARGFTVTDAGAGTNQARVIFYLAPA